VLDPECDVELVVNTRREPVDMTLSLSAGFGGSNAALVLGSERLTVQEVAT
jgi:3-oxoacyl-(acyl-carrier-protein) synthase